MEQIEINDLRLRAFHGVLPAERLIGNIFSVDIVLKADLSAAMNSDSVENTINYAEVIETVRREMSEPSDLLEHVVGRLRRALTAAYPAVIGGSIRLSKLTPPIAGVELASVAVKTSW